MARRGLLEEAAIFPAECRLDLLGFDIDRSSNQWGCMFVATMYELRGGEILDRYSRGVADRWEHDDLELVRFDISGVVRHLLRSDRVDIWTPTAPALCYLALVQRYGKAKVERQTARVLRQRDRPDEQAPAAEVASSSP